MDDKIRLKAIKMICADLEKMTINLGKENDLDLLYKIYDHANTLSMIVLGAIRLAKSNHTDISNQS